MPNVCCPDQRLIAPDHARRRQGGRSMISQCVFAKRLLTPAAISQQDRTRSAAIDLQWHERIIRPSAPRRPAKEPHDERSRRDDAARDLRDSGCTAARTGPPDAGQPGQRPAHRRTWHSRGHRQRRRPDAPRRDRHGAASVALAGAGDLHRPPRRRLHQDPRPQGQRDHDARRGHGDRHHADRRGRAPARDPSDQARAGHARWCAGRHRQPAQPVAGACHAG